MPGGGKVIESSAISEFAEAFRGKITISDDPEYEEGRRVWSRSTNILRLAARD